MSIPVAVERTAPSEPTSRPSHLEEFGRVLGRLRREAGRSQLDLAVSAGVSARHLCFLERSRAHPSRAMVLKLAEALEVPAGVRSRLLTAAGFASQDRGDLAPKPAAALEWARPEESFAMALAVARQPTLEGAQALVEAFSRALGVSPDASSVDDPALRLACRTLRWGLDEAGRRKGDERPDRGSDLIS